MPRSLISLAAFDIIRVGRLSAADRATLNQQVLDQLSLYAPPSPGFLKIPDETLMPTGEYQPVFECHTVSDTIFVSEKVGFSWGDFLSSVVALKDYLETRLDKRTYVILNQGWGSVPSVNSAFLGPGGGPSPNLVVPISDVWTQLYCVISDLENPEGQLKSRWDNRFDIYGLVDTELPSGFRFADSCIINSCKGTTMQVWAISRQPPD